MCNKTNSIKYHFEKDGITYLKCNNCNLIFLDEKSYPSDLIDQYDDRSYFMNYIRGYHIYIKIFEKLIRKIEKFQKPGNILDIGCGIGLLLYVAKKRNWNVFGTEISKFASNFAKNNLKLNVIQSDNLSIFPNDFFDVIIASHVLEHLKNPFIMLKSIREKLRLNGILVVSVPNIGGLLPRLEKQNWRSLQPSQHIYQFSPQTLNLLLKKGGFKSINFNTENRVFKYKFKLLNFILNNFINSLLEKLKLGEAMTIISKKNDKLRCDSKD